GDLLALLQGGEERAQRVRIRLRPRLRDHIAEDREVRRRALVKVGQFRRPEGLFRHRRERLWQRGGVDLGVLQFAHQGRQRDRRRGEGQRRGRDAVLGEDGGGEEVVDVLRRVGAEHVARELRQRPDRRARQRVDRL